MAEGNFCERAGSVDLRAAKRAEYEAFIAAKKAEAPLFGFEPRPVSPLLFDFQRDLVEWAIRRGRAGIFAKFGLGKSLMQLEIARQVCLETGGRFLIVAPLSVRAEFLRDAEKLGVAVAFLRRTEEVAGPGIYLTNYESVRDGKLVRGHWKEQPCGPGGMDRKAIFVEPYWRGPEDAPIAVRSLKPGGGSAPDRSS